MFGQIGLPHMYMHEARVGKGALSALIRCQVLP